MGKYNPEKHTPEYTYLRKAAWYDENRERIIEKRKKYYKTHNEKIKKETSVKRNLNRSEVNENARIWGSKNRDKIKNSRLKAKYGITLKQFNLLLENQNFHCLFCPEKKALGLDHCHFTERIRGILCRKCNAGLGMFRDSTILLKRAIQYLNKKDYRK